MIRLPKALEAFGAPDFADVLKQEIEQVEVVQLPLQQGLSTGSYALDNKFTAMIIGVSDDVEFVRVTAGIFYSAIIAGCGCADDPTPVSELNEYCEVQLCIDKLTAETTVVLAD